MLSSKQPTKMAWVLCFLTALSGHIGLLYYTTHFSAEPIDLSSAVMVEFAAETESIMTLHHLPVGPSQVISVNSRQASHAQPTEVPQQEVALEPSTVLTKAEIVLKEKPKRQKKNKVNAQHKPQEKDNHGKVDSVASAQSLSAPLPLDGTRIAATMDSRGTSQSQRIDWRARVLAYLARNQGYPSVALSQGIEGKVVLKIGIDASGHVHSVAVRKSSGSRLLDEHAVQMVRKKSPLPKPPPDLIGNGTSLTLNIPIDFNISRYKRLSR